MVRDPGTVHRQDWSPGPLEFSQALGDRWYRRLVRNRLWARKNSPEPQVCRCFSLLSCVHLSCLVMALSQAWSPAESTCWPQSKFLRGLETDVHAHETDL